MFWHFYKTTFSPCFFIAAASLKYMEKHYSWVKYTKQPLSLRHYHFKEVFFAKSKSAKGFHIFLMEATCCQDQEKRELNCNRIVEKLALINRTSLKDFNGNCSAYGSYIIFVPLDIYILHLKEGNEQNDSSQPFFFGTYSSLLDKATHSFSKVKANSPIPE